MQDTRGSDNVNWLHDLRGMGFENLIVWYDMILGTGCLSLAFWPKVESCFILGLSVVRLQARSTKLLANSLEERRVF
jgi:hypothetical protein